MRVRMTWVRRTGAASVAVSVAAALLVTTALPARASVPIRCNPAVPSIGGGAAHSLFLGGDGHVKAVGDNYFGELGDGTNRNTRTSMVEAQGLTGVTSVATSPNGNHSLALKSDGTVWAWGLNWSGQLGNGEGGWYVAEEALPQQVSGIEKVVSVAAGADHSMALTEDGTVWAWGRNDDGQLGNGSSSESPVPVQVLGLTNVVAISAGSYHSLAVTASGQVYAWGDNSDGQVGVGYVDYLPHPVPVAVVASGATAVAGGGMHSLALKSDGTMLGWGYNYAGAVGDGSPLDHDEPTPRPVVALTSVSAIAAGYWHSMALKSDGTVWTWGYSSRGQLGNGWYGWGAWTSTPMQVSGIANVKVIAGPGAMSLAVTASGSVYAWGDNYYGQLGQGDYADRAVPTLVPGLSQSTPAAPTNVKAVAGEHNALVTWDAPESAVTQYVITPYRNGVAQPPVGTQLPKLEYAVTGLSEGDTYWFEVQGQNCLGDGAVSSASNRVVPSGVQLQDEGFSLEGQRINDRHGLKVNVFNGNLKIVASDLAIAGTGLNLSIERVYNSRAETSGVLGQDWSSTVGTDVSLEVLPTGSVFLHPGGGPALGFPLKADGVNYESPAGIDATLTKLGDSTYTLRFHFSDEVWSFSTAGKLVSRKDRNDHQLSYTYDPVSGRLATVTDTQGRSVTFTYDLNGRVSQIADSAVSPRLWKYAYDAAGRLTTYTDPANKVTTYAYDANGNLTSVTTPGGAAPVGTRRVTFGYDATGTRVTSIAWQQVPGGPTTRFAYQGTKTVVTDANGNDTVYTFDAVGRTTKVTDAQGNSVSTSYTSNSNVRRYSVGGAGTTYGYSSVNALTSMTYDTGSGYALSYGDASHPYLPTLVEDPQGNELAFAYDTAGNVISETNDHPAPDNKVEIAYNSSGTRKGLPQTVKDPRGTTTGYGYDANGNLTSVDFPSPLGDVSPVVYDSLSRITSVRDGKGQVTSYQYDKLDRVTRITYADGKAVTYVYDGDGNLTSMTDPTGTTTMTYDERNLLSSRTTPDGKTITYTYDGMGNLASITEDGQTVRYTYSAANLPSAVIEPDGGATVFSYDPDYNRTAVRYPNGVSLFSTYDDAKRLSKIVAADATLATLMSFEYSYKDPATGEDTALRQSVTDQDGHVTSYTYDVLNRLTSALTKDAEGATVRHEVYRYDPVSNRTSQTIQDGATGVHTFYRYNAANQLTNNNGVATLSYDGNGNLTASTVASDQVKNEEYVYNAANQATSVRTAKGLPGTYTYRGAGQAERATLDLGGSKVSSFAYTVLGMSSETVAGSATTHVTRDIGGQLVSQRDATGTHYFLTDGLRSVVGLADEDGSVSATYRYDSFGNLVGSSGPEALTRFRFAGQYLDHTGLYKMGQRYYDPTIGRFTQQDSLYHPLDSKQSNRYVYVGGDPVNFKDGSGLCHKSVVGSIIEVLSLIGAGYTFRGVFFTGKVLVTAAKGAPLVVTGLLVAGSVDTGLAIKSVGDVILDGAKRFFNIDDCGNSEEVAPGPPGYSSGGVLT